MAYQKGKIVEDGVRANVYGLMRIPLNVFVVLVLSTTKEGWYSSTRFGIMLTDTGVRHRDLVFTSCSALLLAAVAVNGTLL
jgi:MFS transporter, MFS domain-containing protein family, molybdate-anion transporter